jgi:hypothetical protein
MAGFGFGSAGIAIMAILLAWKHRRLSPRIRIEILASGIVLALFWAAMWIPRW